MSLFSFLSNKLVNTIHGENEKEADSDRECQVRVNLKANEFTKLIELVKNNEINYRPIAMIVYNRKISKFKREIMKPLSKKAKSGCDIYETFVHFKKSGTTDEIIIPFDIFSQKYLKNLSKHKIEEWYIRNMQMVKKYDIKKIR